MKNSTMDVPQVYLCIRPLLMYEMLPSWLLHVYCGFHIYLYTTCSVFITCIVHEKETHFAFPNIKQAYSNPYSNGGSRYVCTYKLMHYSFYFLIIFSIECDEYDEDVSCYLYTEVSEVTCTKE